MKFNLKVALISLVVVGCAAYFGYIAFKTINKNQQLHAKDAETAKMDKEAKKAKYAENLGTNLLAAGQKFNTLDLNLVGHCVISMGEDFSFKTTLDSDKINLSYDEKDLQMNISLRDNFHFGFGGDEMYFEVTVPSLKSINLDGAGEYEISGFKGEELKIRTDGAGSFVFEDLNYKNLTVDQNGLGSLEIQDSQFENADLKLSGAGELDLKQSTVKNAKVNQSGLGQIVLTLDGGSITGKLSGLGQIVCYGDVGSKDINVTGLGKIEFKD